MKTLLNGTGYSPHPIGFSFIIFKFLNMKEATGKKDGEITELKKTATK